LAAKDGRIGGGTEGPFESPSGLSPSYVDDFVASEDGLRFAKAFMQIPRSAVRLRIVALVNELAGGDGDDLTVVAFQMLVEPDAGSPPSLGQMRASPCDSSGSRGDRGLSPMNPSSEL
jgi:hypothetical protein